MALEVTLSHCWQNRRSVVTYLVSSLLQFLGSEFRVFLAEGPPGLCVNFCWKILDCLDCLVGFFFLFIFLSNLPLPFSNAQAGNSPHMLSVKWMSSSCRDWFRG